MPHAFARIVLPMAAAAGLSLLSPSFALAASTVSASVVVSSVQPQARVTEHGAHTLGSAEFAELRGEYRLGTGGSLVVGGSRHRPVAELNDNAPVALWPAGPNHLVSADGKLRLEFRFEANGEVSGLTIHVLPGVR